MRPIKFRMFVTTTKIMIKWEDLDLRYINDEKIFDKNVFKLMQFTGLHDKNGKEIYADSDIFKFKFMKDLDESLDLIGVFTFNGDDLRYEIDVYSKEHPEYVCMFYVGNGVFYDFEIIGNIYENPELLEATK